VVTKCLKNPLVVERLHMLGWALVSGAGARSRFSVRTAGKCVRR
jgi:hypothetical protein